MLTSDQIKHLIETKKELPALMRECVETIEHLQDKLNHENYFKRRERQRQENEALETPRAR